MKKLLILLAILPFMVNTSFSQSYPEEAMSIGFQVTQGEYGYGPIVNYAISKDLHIGTQIGLYYDTGYENKGGIEVLKSNFFFYLAPYAKYYFKNIKNFRPFIQGQFAIFTVEDKVNGSPVSSTTGRYDGNSLWINVGGTWYPFNNVGINAGMRFLDFNLDKSWMRAGLGNPFIGIEWYI